MESKRGIWKVWSGEVINGLEGHQQEFVLYHFDSLGTSEAAGKPN